MHQKSCRFSLSTTEIILIFSVIITTSTNVANASCSVPQVGGKQAIYVKDIHRGNWSEPIFNSSLYDTEAENLRRKNTTYPTETVVRYKCVNPDTQTLCNGTEFIECQSNSTWSGKRPVCLSNRCNFTLHPEKEVRFEFGGYVINKRNGSFPRNTELIYVSCLDKSLQLDSKLNTYHQKCMDDKSWSGIEPKCVPIPLKDEGWIVGGTVGLVGAFILLFLIIGGIIFRHRMQERIIRQNNQNRRKERSSIAAHHEIYYEPDVLRSNPAKESAYENIIPVSTNAEPVYIEVEILPGNTENDKKFVRKEKSIKEDESTVYAQINHNQQ